jgi:hypothetical protein
MAEGCDHCAELAAQYRLARSQFPDADIPELAALILARMDDDALLALAADTLAYSPSAPAGGRYEMAQDVVIKFVSAIESGPADPSGPPPRHA